VFEITANYHDFQTKRYNVAATAFTSPGKTFKPFDEIPTQSQAKAFNTLTALTLIFLGIFEAEL
jgi:hypothetical protein